MNDINLKHWQLERDSENIIWLGLDRAGSKVNTLNLELLGELEQICELYKEDSSIAGFVIYSLKDKGFIAGADLEEFSKLESSAKARAVIETGQGIFNKLAALKFPTVAMIEGFCLGGGLELALACRYRIAEESSKTKLGFPEIKLGIYPGWTGSVRLPRLLGAPAAMNLMLTGRSVTASSARKMGLVNEAVPKRQLKRAARFYIIERPKIKKTSPWAGWTNAGLFRPMIAKLLRSKIAAKVKKNHYPAPYALIDTWQRTGVDGPHAFVAESDTVVQLMHTPTAQNLTRVFFLQERLKGLAKKINYKPEHVHVIGAGVMGGDIAAWCVLQGFKVTLQDREAKFIAPAIARAYQLMQKKLKHSRLVQAAMDRLQPDLQGRGIAHADIIIEAIVEKLEAKQELFAQVEAQARPDAILATNTSSIPLDEINKVLKDPKRLVGLHFFNPVALLPLVEVIHSATSAENNLIKATAFVRLLERTPLPVKSSPGFLVNRILMPYLMEALYLYESGIPAPMIDKAATDFGMPMGPVELADAVGLDVCLLTAEKLVAHFGGVIPEGLRTKVDKGELGKKTGKGFYEYKNGKPIKVKTTAPGDLTIVTNRLILSMLNEAVACVREGIVADGDLVDAGMIFGTGFAPFRGGPIHYARSVGKDVIIAQLQQLETQVGERFKPDAGWEIL